MRIVRCVHDTRRDVRHFSGAEDAAFISHPLFCPAMDHVDDFLPMRVKMKRVAMHGGHVRTDKQQLFRLDEIWAA